MLRNYTFIVVLFIAVSAWGQQNNAALYDPYVPEYFTGNDPAWLQDIVKNPRGVNFFEMEKKFHQWLSTDQDARIKTKDKKPAVNFYRRWRKAYKPFVNPKGEIVLPTKKEYLNQLDNLNKKSQKELILSQRKALAKDEKKWRNIGPNTTSKNDQYIGFQKSYDYQANIFRIDVSKTDSNVLYAGAETGAVFKTVDKGLNWSACDPTYDFGKSIMAIKISPKNKNTVWVGSDLGLFLSENGGKSFTRIEGIDATVNSIRISNDNTDLVSVATVSGFYVSNNKGKTFTKTFNGTCHDHELKPNNSSIIYLLGKKQNEAYFRFYISRDNGNSFNESVEILPKVEMGRLAVSEAPTGADYVYALVNTMESSRGGHGVSHIVKSTDGGLNWEDQTTIEENVNDVRNTFCPAIDGKLGGQGYYDMMIGVSGTDPEHVIFGLCSAYRSLQGGKGGYQANSIGGYCSGNIKMHADMQDIAIVGNEVWIANDGGIKYSSNFFTSEGENRVKGIYASDYHGFGQGWNEDVMAGGRWHNGDAVIMGRYGEGKSVYVGGVEQSTGYVMLSNPRKVYFTDSGMFTMPEEIDGQITHTQLKFAAKSPYEILKSHGFLTTDPRYAQRILLNSSNYNEIGQIWQTTDEGTTFNLLHDTDGEPVSNIEFARSNPNVLYACGIYNIYKSENNGKSWKELERIPEELGFFYYNNNPTSYIAIDPKDENTIWAVQSVTKGAVAYSKDGGNTWHNPLNEEMKKVEFRWVVLAGDEDNGVYLGTDEGAKVYYKDDKMTDWIDYSNGLPPAVRLTRLIPFFKEGKLRAATSQGIWEIPLYREKFKPVAQPMATNIGGAELSNANEVVQFDSYSIVNQNEVEWEWTFSPEPYSVDNNRISNPKVIFKYNGDYDVTLKVKTPQGEHSRTIKSMIKVRNGKDRPSTPTPVEPTPEFKISPTTLKSGEYINVEVKGIKGEKILKIYSPEGELVKETKIEDGITKVSTEGFSAGVYRYEFESGKLNKTGQITIKEKENTPKPVEPTPEFKISPTTLKVGEFINVEVKGIEGEKILKLYSPEGKLIKEIKIEKEITKIYTEGFSAGVYRYEFKSDKLSENGQITIESEVIKPKDDDFKFKIYPTLLKSGEVLILEMKGLSGEKQFTIYDAKGALIKDVRIKADKEQISTHGLIKGVYIYQFKTPTFKQYGKFMID